MRYLALAALLVAGCGNNGSGTRDAGDGPGDEPDADSDADIDADPNVRGPVSVVIVDKNGAALAGMHVVFIDTDATVTDVVTDAAGTVTASVYPGASATAIRARDGGVSYSLTTVLSLVPNDMVTLISASGAASSTEDPFTQRIVPLPSADITTASKASGTVTFTTVRPHGLAVNDEVVVSGVAPDGAFNGKHAVTGTPTPTTFNVAISGGLTASAGGTAYKALPFTVSFPSYGGATSYEVHTPCGPVDVGTTLSPVLTLREGCAVSPMDVLVFAKTSSTTEAAFAQQLAVSFTPGGSVTITDTWHPVASVAATYSNPTTRVTGISLERFTPHVRGNAPAIANDTTTGGPVALAVDTAVSSVAWMNSLFACPTGSGADCISSPIGVAQQKLAERVDGTQTTHTVDVGASLLPWVNAVYLPQTTTLDIAVTGTGAIDLYEANIRFFRMVSTTQVIYTWRVFGAVPETFAFPTLPSTVPGDPTVRPTDTQSAYQVYLCESDAVSGYRDAIKNPYRSLATCETPSSPTQKPFGGTRNRVSSWN